MIPVRSYAGRRVGVLGLGRSGLAAARALAAGGAEVVCWDDAAEAGARAEAEGFTIADLSREREAAALAALIVSPGIPHLYPQPHPAVARAVALGVPLDNDVGLFFRALGEEALEGEATEGPPPRVVCVTGSNGKSTTTALIHHILTQAGRAAQLGGNIGRGVLDLDPPEPGSVVVLELSSYQCELARSLAPDIAVFLNLSDDHLDRHGGRGGYFAAKRRLLELGAPERAVIGVDEAEGRFLLATSGDAIAVSTTGRPAGPGWAVVAKRGHLAEWREGRLIASLDLREAPALPGVHNHQNASAAWAACRALGLGPRQIAPGLLSFPGLPHRLERVGEARGVVFVNDSKATNADAAARALATFERVRWIAGGRPKAGGIASLAPLLGRVAKAYLIGEAAEDFARTLAQAGAAHEIAGTLEGAVARAWAEAEAGEVILLAPACASFDQFADFEARGEAFRRLATTCLADAGRSPEGAPTDGDAA